MDANGVSVFLLVVLLIGLAVAGFIDGFSDVVYRRMRSRHKLRTEFLTPPIPPLPSIDTIIGQRFDEVYDAYIHSGNVQINQAHVPTYARGGRIPLIDVALPDALQFHAAKPTHPKHSDAYVDTVTGDLHVYDGKQWCTVMRQARDHPMVTSSPLCSNCRGCGAPLVTAKCDYCKRVNR